MGPSRGTQREDCVVVPSSFCPEHPGIPVSRSTSRPGVRGRSFLVPGRNPAGRRHIRPAFCVWTLCYHFPPCQPGQENRRTDSTMIFACPQAGPGPAKFVGKADPFFSFRDNPPAVHEGGFRHATYNGSNATVYRNHEKKLPINYSLFLCSRSFSLFSRRRIDTCMDCKVFEQSVSGGCIIFNAEELIRSLASSHSVSESTRKST